MKKYNRDKNVYHSAIERIEYVFDNFKTIIVSCSGGKDSIVLTYLVQEVAKKLNRKFFLFFLDQEIEYSSTINIIDYLMKMDCVIPLWFQVPALLTNTSSIEQHTIDPWNKEKKIDWVHKQKVNSIKKIDWAHNVPFTFKKEKKYGFYGILQCMEQMFKGEDVAQFVGLRADESLDRFRAVTKNPGYKDVMWSTRGKFNTKFYPIYDWNFKDLFVYLGKNNKKYNKMYDYFNLKGYRNKQMRLSNLLHEKAYECIADLQEFEPKLYDRILNRCMGIATAQEYAGRGGGIYKVEKLPEGYFSWVEYRDYLISTIKNREHANTFKIRFSKQYQNDYVVKQQCNRILIYDINNFKKINNFKEDPKVKIRERWMKEL